MGVLAGAGWEGGGGSVIPTLGGGVWGGLEREREGVGVSKKTLEIEKPNQNQIKK